MAKGFEGVGVVGGGGWSVISMKVISYNARGLGGGEKRVEVQRLVKEKNPFVLCIPESKFELCR